MMAQLHGYPSFMRVDYKSQIDQWISNTLGIRLPKMQDYLEWPITQLESAHGCWVSDTEGKRYLDGNASNWSKVHGHNDPDLNVELILQMQKMAHVSYSGLSHPTASKLCAQLALDARWADAFLFTDNGSCAIEMAIKLSFQYWQMAGMPDKREVIALRNGYHGDTIGSMSVGDAGGFHNRFNAWMFKKHVIPALIKITEYAGKKPLSDDTKSLDALKNLLEAHSEKIALMTMEPWVLDQEV